MTSGSFDWADYNKKKVHEVEMLFDPAYIASKLKIPEVSNEGKNGRPYIYTNAEIAYYALPATYLGLPYRQSQGLAMILAKIAKRDNVPDYTTLFRRKISLTPDTNNIDMKKKTTIAVDSTGIKVTNHGDWLRKKWKAERKGFIKLHLAVDVETKEIIAYEITNEKSHDNKQFDKLVEKSKKKRKVKKVLADGAYDCKKNLNRKDVDVAIRIRKNASDKSNGSKARKEMAKDQKNDWNLWREVNGFGMRWMVETANSVFKGLFGEAVMAKLFKNMVHEMAWKITVFNLMRLM